MLFRIVGGDFNIHVQDDGDVDARHLHELLVSFGMIQHFHAPTHRCGSTLDLVITFGNCQLNGVTVDPPGVLSDYSLVMCQLLLSLDPASLVESQVRAWRRVDRDVLRQALMMSAL